MGPRFFKRGEVILMFIVYSFDDASMGPRFFKRGEARPGCRFQVESSSFNGATLLQAWRVVEVETDGNTLLVLQWGHASSSVESLITFQTQITTHVASMGPRFFKRGENHIDELPLPRRTSFNGATLLQAWRDER